MVSTLFTRRASTDLSGANYELYVIRADGTHDVRVTYTPGPDILPIFSPNGKWLMWTCKRSGNNTSQVFVAKFTPPAGW